jgi:hypothetical protein
MRSNVHDFASLEVKLYLFDANSVLNVVPWNVTVDAPAPRTFRTSPAPAYAASNPDDNIVPCPVTEYRVWMPYCWLGVYDHVALPLMALETLDPSLTLSIYDDAPV